MLEIKISKYSILMLLLLSVSLGCQKVVDIPLNEADQQIVVEAVGKSLEGQSYVLLSKTISSTQSSSDVEWLSGAVVEFEDGNGDVFVFSEEDMVPGKYVNDSFTALPNMNYKLNVSHSEGLVTAETSSMTKPQIDSLFVFQNIGGVDGTGTDTTNVLIYTVTDNPIEKNFYRFVLWVNGERNKDIFIETDDLGNGLTYTSPFFGISFDSNDHIYAELWSITADDYSYFFGLFNNLNQSPFSAAPADPPSSIEGGLGYYTVAMVDTMSIVIP